MASIQRMKPSRKPLNIILRRQQENMLKTKEIIKRRAKAGLGIAKTAEKLGVFSPKETPAITSVRAPRGLGKRQKPKGCQQREAEGTKVFPSITRQKQICSEETGIN